LFRHRHPEHAEFGKCVQILRRESAVHVFERARLELILCNVAHGLHEPPLLFRQAQLHGFSPLALPTLATTASTRSRMRVNTCAPAAAAARVFGAVAPPPPKIPAPACPRVPPPRRGRPGRKARPVWAQRRARTAGARPPPSDPPISPITTMPWVC